MEERESIDKELEKKKELEKEVEELRKKSVAKDTSNAEI